MIPLALFSLLIWAILFERFLAFRKLKRELPEFHERAQNLLLRDDRPALQRFCTERADLPTAQVLLAALDRLDSSDERLRKKWREAMERRRLLVNQDVRKNLWVLGTLATASPFVGLFGTVLGILQSFHQIARTGAGGFTVVASGISEALVATAAGILVAVVASLAYNSFQTFAASFVLLVKSQSEELSEVLMESLSGSKRGTAGE